MRSAFFEAARRHQLRQGCLVLHKKERFQMFLEGLEALGRQLEFTTPLIIFL